MRKLKEVYSDGIKSYKSRSKHTAKRILIVTEITSQKHKAGSTKIEGILIRLEESKLRCQKERCLLSGAEYRIFSPALEVH